MKINPKPFIPLILAFYKLWRWLVRYDDKGEWQQIVTAVDAGTPVLIALWHNELFAASCVGHGYKGDYVIMVSQSRDGDLLAAILAQLGHGTVRGSSSRGGLRALLSLVREIRRHKVGIVAVDGPRGPRHEVKDGVIFAAQRAQALIFPIRAFARKKLVFNSWDKFEVPYPFAKCRVRVGHPFVVTKEKLTAEIMQQEKERLHHALQSIEDDS